MFIVVVFVCVRERSITRTQYFNRQRIIFRVIFIGKTLQQFEDDEIQITSVHIFTITRSFAAVQMKLSLQNNNNNISSYIYNNQNFLTIYIFSIKFSQNFFNSGIL